MSSLRLEKILMPSYEIQWLIMAVHWLHVIVVIPWIGASFYIISWENKFNRIENLRPNIEGDFWTMQGGDFYSVEKLRNPPRQLPERLHLFRYEAYLTWLSGFALMCLSFYLDPSSRMIDKRVAEISPPTSILISISSLVLCWVLYDLYCRTRLARRLRISAAIGLLALTGLSYLFTRIFGERAAFIQVGAVMGTIMSGNVFFAIIPWHKKVIRAIQKGEPVDLLYAQRPGFRSRHNHYMTFPILFVMLGGHFPAVFSHPHNWAVLTGVAFSAGLLKHYHNLVQRRQPGLGFLIAGIVVFVGVAYASSRATTHAVTCVERVSFAEPHRIISTHCVSCHSALPTERTMAAAPMGIQFDTPQQIVAHSERIFERAVMTRTMPLGNKSGMTLEDRRLLGCWIQDGAHISER